MKTGSCVDGVSPQVNSMSAMAAAQLKAGDTVPAGVTLDLGFPPSKIDLASYIKGKKVILMGLPGAFTPT